MLCLNELIDAYVYSHLKPSVSAADSVFKVREETIKEVLAGISELIGEDKKPEET